VRCGQAGGRVRPLNADHLGAMVSQHHAGEGSWPDTGDFDDA
jgi:hypothetical protein